MTSPQLNEALFRSLFEHISSGVAVYEAVDGGDDFVIAAFNKAAEKIESIGREQVIGRRVTEVFPGVREFGLLAVFQRVYRTGVAETYPISLYQDERISGWRDNYVYKLPSGEVVATYDDVTAKKQIEEDLRETRAFFERIVERSPYAMWISDPAGTVIQTNRALRETLGLSDEQIVGNYNVLEDANLLAQGLGPKLRAVFEQREHLTFSLDWKARDVGHGDFERGRDLHIEASMLPILNARGELRNVVCQWTDVTDRVRAETALRELNQTLEQRVSDRTAQLEASNRELESFAYSVSHDLRAPLRSISGFAHIIANRHRADLNDEGRHYFDNILEASANMARLIDDLLRYARLGPKSLTLAPIEIGRALHAALETLAMPIRESGAQIDLPDDLPAVLANETLLEQMFVNLIGNALAYQPPGGVPVITIRWSETGGRVAIHIADNGIGIAPRFHEKIFQPFQRLHPADVYPGTGIGLAIVAKAASLMAGRVAVESEPGKGSTFHVTLMATGPSAEGDKNGH